MPTIKGPNAAARTQQVERHMSLAEKSAQLLAGAAWDTGMDLGIADHLAGAVLSALERAVAVLDGTPLDDAQLERMANTAKTVTETFKPFEGKVSAGDYRSSAGPGYAAVKAGPRAQGIVDAQRTLQEMAALAEAPPRPLDEVLTALGGGDQDMNALFKAALEQLVVPDEVSAVLIHLHDTFDVGVDNLRMGISRSVASAKEPFWNEGLERLSAHAVEQAAAKAQEMEAKFGPPVTHTSLNGSAGDVAAQLATLAESEQKPQRYEFNGKDLVAYPGESADDAIARWRAAPWN